MSMLQEFKKFAMRGNVIDLAVGVVIGAAFGKIVSSLVDQVIMPPIGLATGGVNVSDWKYVLSPAQLDAAGKETAAEVAVRYGDFLQQIVNFLIIAFVIFLLVKAINRLAPRPEDQPAVQPPDVVLLTEIRDLLKNKA